MDTNYEELAYLQLIKTVIETGEEKSDRTGVGTVSLFSCSLDFNLTDGFPLLTTKKMAWKSVLRELIWFISGSTDAKVLQKQNVHIWDGNTSKEFIQKNKLNLKEGDIGPLYSFQWRHFGAEYIDCDTDYTNQGIDQIKYVEDELKNNPTSRRILFSAWNPIDIKKSVLPPCHIMAQFYVRSNKYLDIQVYSRSIDMILGCPFNIASYACMTYMWAKVLNLEPGKMKYTFGDTHVYKNHITGAKEQIVRVPYKFPKLNIKRKVNSIFEYVEDDFEIIEYSSHPSIKFKMAI